MTQYEAGKMYVVWKDNPDVRSREDGIELLVKRLRFAEHSQDRAECWGVLQEAQDDVVEAAFCYFRDKDNPRQETVERPLNPMSFPLSKAYKKAVKEFGPRAVYEVTLRLVGTVDATGKLTSQED